MKLENVIIDKVSTQKDGSLKITLTTRELSVQEIAEIFLSANKEIAVIDVPEPTEKEEKSPASRMRAVFYRLWEQKGKPLQSFEIFYRSEMERLIDFLKEKLN